ncbi:MAG: hypothetical protein ABSG76_27115 [Xanthobacteraceae bacterium]
MPDIDLSPASLDRSKPFGTVHGDLKDGVHFWQDGLPFDAQGKLAGASLTDEQRVRAERLARKSARLAPRQAAAAGAVDEEQAPDAGDVNLEAWLRGDAKYLYDAVRTAIRGRYQKDCPSIGDAVEFLVFEVKLVDRKLVAKRLLPK